MANQRNAKLKDLKRAREDFEGRALINCQGGVFKNQIKFENEPFAPGRA
jgi:hypothetical protein